jgi:non-specific serine/threonine protein kinase
MAIESSDIGQARAALDEAGVLARQLDDASVLASVTQYLSLAAEHEGDVETSLALGDQALTGHRALGDLTGTSTTLCQMSRMAALAGHPRSAELCGEFLALCEAHSAEWSRVHALWVVGVDKWRRGHPDEAVTAIQDALRRQRSSGELEGCMTHCLETLAWAEAYEGQHQRAARLLGAAKAARTQPGPSPAGREYLRGEQALCEERARTALGDEGFATAFREGTELDRGNAVGHGLQEKAGQKQAVSSHPASHAAEAVLTRRELQVAELVAQGLSNKDIAARLVIAQRTAEGHVQRILTKLGFTSRTRLATWVTQQQKPCDSS